MGFPISEFGTIVAEDDIDDDGKQYLCSNADHPLLIPLTTTSPRGENNSGM